MSETKCRHRKTWLVAGGFIEWCYECGAIRQMQRTTVPNWVMPMTGKDGNRARFIKPVGAGGENPYEKLVDS